MRTNIYITLELCTALALGTSACSDDQTPVGVAGSAGAGGSSGGAPPTGGAGGGGANAGTGGASAGTPSMGGGGGTSGGVGADAGTRDAGTRDAAAPPDDAGEQPPPVCNIVDDQLVLPEGSSCTLTPEQMEEYNLAGDNVVSCRGGAAFWGGIGGGTLELNGLQISCESA